MFWSLTVFKQPDDVPDEASCHYGQGFVHLGLILTAQVKDLAAKYVGHLQQFSQVLIHDGYFEGFESSSIFIIDHV